MSAMAPQITGVSFTQPFVQARIKENIEVPRHCPATGEFPEQKASNPENISIWWRHHGVNCSSFYMLLTSMMTSSNGNIFRVTGQLCGEFTGPQWIPHTKASDAELWCFDLRLNKRLSKQWWGWWFQTLSRPLWRHRHALIISMQSSGCSFTFTTFQFTPYASFIVWRPLDISDI